MGRTSHCAGWKEYPLRARRQVYYSPDARLGGGGLMFVGVWWDQESDAEIAFIADRAAEGGCEKDSVKDVFPKSSSSRLVVSVTPATRTNRQLIEVRHGYISRSRLGPI